MIRGILAGIHDEYAMLSEPLLELIVVLLPVPVSLPVPIGVVDEDDQPRLLVDLQLNLALGDAFEHLVMLPVSFAESLQFQKVVANTAIAFDYIVARALK